MITAAPGEGETFRYSLNIQIEFTKRINGMYGRVKRFLQTVEQCALAS